MGKAISSVIGALLMLIITIGLVGFAYSYISGTFSSKIATIFEIIDTRGDTITIRNSGTEPITSFSSVTIDGSPATYRVAAQDTSLLGYWKMDEPSWVNDCSAGTVGDSANSNYGKSCPAGSGPTGGAGGNFGNAGSFDGINDVVSVDDKPELRMGTNSFTISLWVNSGTNSGFRHLVNKGRLPPALGNGADNGYGIQYSDGSVGIGLNSLGDGGQAWFAFSISQGVWAHIAFVVDRGANRIYAYKNGDLISSTALTVSGDISHTKPLDIGGYTGIPAYSFPGLIDEVKIYNRSLSGQEIKSEYATGSQINAGGIADVKVYNTLSSGTHRLRLCTESLCSTAVLTIV